MSKVFVIAIVIFASVGCASKNYSWKHPEYGGGHKDNVHFMKASAECEKEIYKKGIEIEGKVYTSKEKIEPFQKEYTEWMINETVNNFRNPSYKYKTLEKYVDLERSRKDHSNCKKRKGWVFKV